MWLSASLEFDSRWMALGRRHVQKVPGNGPHDIAPVRPPIPSQLVGHDIDRGLVVVHGGASPMPGSVLANPAQSPSTAIACFGIRASPAVQRTPEPARFRCVRARPKPCPLAHHPVPLVRRRFG
jgi:hypothetical protein